MFAVIRKTYGFNKKTDRISLSQLVNMTGLDKSHVSRTLRELSERNVLLFQPCDEHQRIGISKNYKNWKTADKGLPKQPRLPKQPQGVAKTAMRRSQNGQAGVAETATTKDNTTKDTTTKDTIQKTTRARGDALVVLDGLNLEAWQDYEQHRRDRRLSNLKPMSANKQQQWLVEQGDHQVQRAIIDKTIRNNWQGLFPLKPGDDNNTGKRPRVNPKALEGMQ